MKLKTEENPEIDTLLCLMKNEFYLYIFAVLRSLFQLLVSPAKLLNCVLVFKFVRALLIFVEFNFVLDLYVLYVRNNYHNAFDI